MKEKIKILVADDNLDFISNVVTYFQDQNDMEIIATAKDGIDACEKIIRERPTVALLDVIMPHLDGLGVLEKLCSTNQQLDEGWCLCPRWGRLKEDQVVVGWQ